MYGKQDNKCDDQYYSTMLFKWRCLPLLCLLFITITSITAIRSPPSTFLTSKLNILTGDHHFRQHFMVKRDDDDHYDHDETSISGSSQSTGTNPGSLESIIERCQSDCPHRMMNLLEEELDMSCDAICKIRLCQTGCNYWYLSASVCFQACHNESLSLISSSLDHQEADAASQVTNNDSNDLHSLKTSPFTTYQDNYCALGCNHAHTIYAQHIHSLLDKNGALNGPRLVSNTLSNDSLAIEWNVSKLDPIILRNLTATVQWKYDKLPVSQWFNVGKSGSIRLVGATSHQQHNQHHQVNPSDGYAHLTGLNAYTSYRFRIRWTMKSWPHAAIYSNPSDEMTTIAYGTPSSACMIMACIAISNSQISVNWRAPQFPNGPIIAYSLYLVNAKTGHRTVKDIYTHWHDSLYRSSNLAKHHYVFNDLQKRTDYNLSIVTHNNFGEGPRCHCQVSTKVTPHTIAKQSAIDDHEGDHDDGDDSDYESDYEDQEKDEGNDQFKLYFASTISLMRRNVQPISDEDILYHVTDYVRNAHITGMAIHVAKRYLFVADSSGTIRRILLKEKSVNQVLRIMSGSNEPSNLCVDWLNDRLYWMEDWNRIMRSNLNGESVQSIHLNWLQAAGQKLTEFKVDPYNGYLFWLQVNIQTNRTGIYRLDLYYLNQATISHTASTNSFSANMNQLRSKMELIYQSESLIWTFAISYDNYRLWFGMSHTDAIHSITMDGNDETTIRDKPDHMEKSPFVNMANMLIYNQRLYFSTGPNIYWEEYHQEDDTYYHNSYTTQSQLISLAIMDNQTQPIPIPLSPVTGVEAVFLDTSAKIYWQKPDLLVGSGRGAWQQWSYEVAIEHVDTQSVHIAEVADVTCDAVELKPDTKYSIRVRAKTSSGKGAWSLEFVGRTLPLSNNDRPFALIATNDALISTDLDGKFKQQLLVKHALDSFSINAVSQHDTLIVMNSNEHLLLYNQSNSRLKEIVNNSNAESIALEWMAHKVYWSNPSERMICRCNLDGSQIEMLPIISYAKQIAIDSLNAHLYWSTSSSLRISLLNGMKHSHKLFYRSADIRSLTIDTNQKKLYWIVSSAGSQMPTFASNTMMLDESSSITLHQMDLFDSLDQVTDLSDNRERIQRITINHSPSNNIFGPVAAWADRFWWLDKQNARIMVSDDGAKAFATIRQVSNVNAFQIIMPNQQHANNYTVVPEAVNPDSIRIVGTWQNCTIEWNAVNNVNYGKLFYEVTIQNVHEESNASMNTVNTVVVLVNGSTSLSLSDNFKTYKPYSKIRIAIRSFTYWASARQVVVSLHVPSSIPSQPVNVRVFTWIDHNDQWTSRPAEYVAEVRWSAPENPNGLICSYTVSLWTVPAISSHNEKLVNSQPLIMNHVIDNQLSYRIEHLKPNHTYYLQVRATTDAGEGPPSDVIHFVTDHNQIPTRLLIAQSDSIIQLDIDSMAVRQMSTHHSLSMPYAIDYCSDQNRIYFVQDGNFIKSIQMPSLDERHNVTGESDSHVTATMSPTSKLHAHLPQTITSLSCDWIGRRLYISTVNLLSNSSTIWTHQLDSETTEKVIDKVDGHIHTLVIDPYRSLLLWSEQLWSFSNKYSHHNPVIVMKQCSLFPNGTRCSNPEDYFQTARQQSNLMQNNGACNCSTNTNGNIGSTFVLVRDLETQNIPEHKIIYFDRTTHSFVECRQRCYCRRLTSFVHSSNAPVHIQIDYKSNMLYWTNSTSRFNGDLYRTTMTNYFVPTKTIHLGKPIRSMIQMQQQTFPFRLQCLTPDSYGIRVNLSLVRKTFKSLQFDINLDRDNETDCWSGQQYRATLAPIRYQIEYCLDEANQSECGSLSTYNQTVLINQLKPFSNYSLTIKLENYYQKLLSERTRLQYELARNASLVHDNEHSKSLIIGQLIGPFVFSTGLASPDQPSNVQAIVKSPDKILITWQGQTPPNATGQPQVAYEIRTYSIQNETSKAHLQHWQGERCNEMQYCVHLENIEPGRTYNVSVKAFYTRIGSEHLSQRYSSAELSSEPVTIQVKSFDEPPTAQVSSTSPRQIDLQVKFDKEKHSNIESFQIWYRCQQSSTNKSDWRLLVDDQIKFDEIQSYQMKSLKPNSQYGIKMLFIYRPFKTKFQWPSDGNGWLVRTNMTVPDAPEQIIIQKHGQDVYEMSWKAVEPNADSPVYYLLYKRQALKSSTFSSTSSPSFTGSGSSSDWELAYNGTQTHWVVTRLKDGVRYHFRLYASNRFGVNDRDWAKTDRPFGIGRLIPISPDELYDFYPRNSDLQTSPQQAHHPMYMLAFVLMSIVAIALIAFLFCYIRYFKIGPKQTDSNDSMLMQTSSHNIELTPWQQIPLPHLSNSLYVNSHVASIAENIDLSDMQVFDFKTITLVKLIGKGAFGEVHEAILQKTQQKVAVKLLNKSSTKNTEDSCNFLKEAKFMSKFKHPHILDMLGVCLNHHCSSIVIVMELMEAGDLLKYLRSNRSQIHPNNAPGSSSSSSGYVSETLTLDDLMSICIDVAKGCEYLQQNQFVHRDLAARNCLVSNADRSKRVVKIADFGLTRGLYQQTYYRKEGGLMPVRWMSPESLSDGLFTTQSDVWSFSVIMYEVMTLGQQPYQAYSNKEVLEYVKCGGILERPSRCPQAMYSLMKRCWTYEKELRPSFGIILNELNQLRESLNVQPEINLSLLTNCPQAVLQESPTSAGNIGMSEHEQQLQPITPPKLINQTNQQCCQALTTVHNQSYQSTMMPFDVTSSPFTCYPNAQPYQNHIIDAHQHHNHPTHHQTSPPSLSHPTMIMSTTSRPRAIYSAASTTLTSLHSSLDSSSLSSAVSFSSGSNVGQMMANSLSPSMVLEPTATNCVTNYKNHFYHQDTSTPPVNNEDNQYEQHQIAIMDHNGNHYLNHHQMLDTTTTPTNISSTPPPSLNGAIYLNAHQQHHHQSPSSPLSHLQSASTTSPPTTKQQQATAAASMHQPIQISTVL